MSILDLDQVQAWISQFDFDDRDIAVRLLNALQVIDSDSQDASLRSLLYSTFSDHTIFKALFAVRETAPGYYSNDENSQSLGSISKIGSEGRIARLIRDVAREDSSFLSHPSIIECRQNRPTPYLLIDDFAGTGNRIRSFARWLYKDPHIKSLYSLGKIRFHGYAAAATPTAIEAIRHDPLFSSFNFAIHARTFSTVGWSPLQIGLARAVCRKYALRTQKKHLALGYKDSAVLTLLSATSPNNVPAILWASGRNWNPLLPHAHVPEDLRLELLSKTKLSLGDRLREQGRSALEGALEGNALSDSSKKLVALLAVSTKFRSPWYRSERLSMILGLPTSEVRALFDFAKRCQFLDQHGRLTDAGRFELSRLGNSHRLPMEPPIRKARTFYYPKSFRDQPGF